ncbi:CaiB/BaiF CoA transferase family protein [Mycolicibacterium sp. XJ1819]
MDGVRVLEVAEHTFVPAASAVLSDWGADVIKVEHAERGDAMRGLASTGVIDLSGGVHVLLEHSNRGKRSIGLDLTNAGGRDVLYRLVAQADVFITNKPPSMRAHLGIDVDDIQRRNSSIIYARGSATGPRGDESEAGGYDMTAFWCRAGGAAGVMPSEDAGVLNQPAPAFGDSIGAMTIAGGIAAALLRRERTGEPCVLDVSLLGAGVWAMGAGIALSRQTGQKWEQPPLGFDHLRNPLATSYRTADGRWLNFTMLQGLKYWPEVATLINRAELAADPRFESAALLAENAPVAARIVADEIGRHDLAEWVRRLRTTGFTGQWAIVQDSVEVADDPQVRANDYMITAQSSSGVEFELAATPVQFDERSCATRRAPDFNEHGDQILRDELGLDDEAIIKLKIDGGVA